MDSVREGIRSLSEFESFALALGATMPRTLGLFVMVPIFHAELLPTMLRLGVAAVVGLVVAPTLVPAIEALHLQPLDPLALVMLVAKEVFVGFVMGALLAIPFLAFEALGFLIDNQRGASISATLNPLTGNDSSPLGLLFNQAFIVFFLISGAFLILLDLLYGSFQLWPVFEWTPTLRPGSMPFFIEQLMQVVNLGLLLAAPAIVAMLLAEIGLALISLAVPQLQVFFLAMPIKSALVLLLLLFYLGTLFEYGGEQIERLREIVPLLHEQWRGAGT